MSFDVRDLMIQAMPAKKAPAKKKAPARKRKAPCGPYSHCTAPTCKKPTLCSSPTCPKPSYCPSPTFCPPKPYSCHQKPSVVCKPKPSGIPKKKASSQLEELRQALGEMVVAQTSGGRPAARRSAR